MKKLNILLTGLFLLSLSSCRSGGKSCFIPEIAGPYVLVYEPQPDVYYGPDTKDLRTGETYALWQPNDHCFVQGSDGYWHAFGITHPATLPGQGLHQGEYASFHAVSPAKSFERSCVENSWADQPKVLPPQERPDEIPANHAPVIIKEGALYRMIYGHTPFRMAVSEDLYHWTPVGEIGSGILTDGRDPNLMYWNETYYLVYCAGNCVKASTSANLRDWTEPVVIFNPPQETDQCESPTLLHYGEKFYLFWCIWDSGDPNSNPYDERTYVYASDNPLDFGGQPLLTELKGHAPEIFQDEKGQWYISSADYPGRGLSVAPLMWK
ncbi:MAG: family 43 glycosylhydrolase [Tannerella sp.]|jgi:beta-fructofuranosidase|nr:family 43 glycosylhydrolase [Tannerella sp.]